MPITGPRKPRTAHPYALIFPRGTHEEDAELKEDIRVNGQCDPTLVWNDLVIDGVRREKACAELGIETLEEVISIPECDLLNLVMSKNQYRRHMTTSQRAAVAAKLTNLKHGGHSLKKSLKEDLRPAMTQEDAAKMLNIGRPSVENAVRVRKAVEKGEVSSTLLDDVKEGKITLGKALKQVKAAQGTRGPGGKKITKPTAKVKHIPVHTAADPVQEPCTDCETPQDHWQLSLSNLAGDAASMEAFWTRQFGDWKKFEVTSELVTLAEQAAKTWTQLASALTKRRKVS